MPGGHIDDIRLKYLLEKYLAGSCSYDEMEELLGSVRDGVGEVPLFKMLEAFWQEARGQKPSPDTDSVALYRAVILREGELSRRRRLRKRRIVRYRTVGLAAVLALLFATYLVAVLRKRPSTPEKAVVTTKNRFRNDVKPGGNRAVLVLASGQSIVLDSAGTGMLAVQGGMKVIKLNNGQLQYRAGGDAQSESAPVYNMITTPRGGQYELILQDGTKVWLNSESSLRFPTAFAGKERAVELSGEAYFEVAPRAVNPFKIYMLHQDSADKKYRKEIDVLGTSFNVMAYEEERVVRTTLLEGAIRVGDESEKQVLKPGQQAEWPVFAGASAGGAGAGVSGAGTAGSGMAESDAVRVKDDADVDAAVAWKKGFFSFDRSDIRTIMRQLSRWYDLKVSYNNNGGIGKQKEFWGGIQKNLPLSDVLKILEKSGIQFYIDGNNVIVNM
ncbi:MAG TPA: FecR domain-containing protein [Puia sp.]|jgi:ferric-dicitrate binding protein FerR (iron transport regulator)|nr:FecR domain-containing protein [Puia sp.]